MSLRYFDNLRYGSFSNLEALVDPATRELWVAQAAIERMLDLRENSAREKLASKSFKSFTGKDLNLGKIVSAKRINGRPCKIRAVPFDTFLKLVFWQSKQNNPAADALLVAGFTDSFTSLILEQCGVKVSTQERQETVSFYLTGYHGLLDWVRDEYVRVYGCKPGTGYYKEINTAINQALFGFNHVECDRLSNASTADLRKIENFHMFAHERIKQGKWANATDPAERINQALKVWS